MSIPIPHLPAGCLAVVTVQILEPRDGAGMAVTHMSSGTISKPAGGGGEGLATQVGKLAVGVTYDALINGASTVLSEPTERAGG